MVNAAGLGAAARFILDLLGRELQIAKLADATGLMIIWADIDLNYVLRFQEWHNCEHVPERMSIPGFLRGRR